MYFNQLLRCSGNAEMERNVSCMRRVPDLLSPLHPLGPTLICSPSIIYSVLMSDIKTDSLIGKQ